MRWAAAPWANGGDAAAAAPVLLAVSRLTVPMLTKAATRILSEWASTSDALAVGVLAVCAEQLLPRRLSRVRVCVTVCIESLSLELM